MDNNKATGTNNGTANPISLYRENLKKNGALIHCITNYVTVTDCANILIASGASPIMSDDIEEVEAITSICNGLCINIGTLNQQTIPSMFLAAKKASQLGHPVLLDPVGVGASPLRTNTASRLLEQISFTAIRGNISEIKVLGLGKGTTKGVDANELDAINDDTIYDVIKLARGISEDTGAIVVITGATDLIVYKDKSALVQNGHPKMAEITGSGCMLSALLTGYLAANKDNMFEAAIACLCHMGIAGEYAERQAAKEGKGNATFSNYLIDFIGTITSEQLERDSRYEKL
jgi:hydroxyethylthiazole kinase